MKISDMLYEATQDLWDEAAELLKDIFMTCAGYENELWDELYS